MAETDKHAGNVLLLRVGMLTLLIALVLAWCLVLTKGMQLPFALEIFKQTDKLLSAHLDFLMMTIIAALPNPFSELTAPLAFTYESEVFKFLF